MKKGTKRVVGYMIQKQSRQSNSQTTNADKGAEQGEATQQRKPEEKTAGRKQTRQDTDRHKRQQPDNRRRQGSRAGRSTTAKEAQGKDSGQTDRHTNRREHNTTEQSGMHISPICFF